MTSPKWAWPGDVIGFDQMTDLSTLSMTTNYQVDRMFGS